MNWTTIIEISAAICYFVGFGLSVYRIRQVKKDYKDQTVFVHEQMRLQTKDFDFHIDRLTEEIELLKTNEGLYDVRNDPEKYQTFLELIRRK